MKGTLMVAFFRFWRTIVIDVSALAAELKKKTVAKDMAKPLAPSKKFILSPLCRKRATGK